MKYITKDNKIFIAGHKGMVGSAIFRNLKNNGYHNLLTANRVDLDLTDTSRVKNWYKINKPDVVIIAAAKVGGILANSNFPTQFLLDNLKIQNNLIECAWKNDVNRDYVIETRTVSCCDSKYSHVRQPYPAWKRFLKNYQSGMVVYVDL